jgi:hypothetical protein
MATKSDETVPCIEVQVPAACPRRPPSLHRDRSQW